MATAATDRANVQLPSGWIRTIDRQTGRLISVGVPSKSEPGKYHLVTRNRCDCRGFSYRKRCAHHDALAAILFDAVPNPPCSICGRDAHANAAEANQAHAAGAAKYRAIFGQD